MVGRSTDDASKVPTLSKRISSPMLPFGVGDGDATIATELGVAVSASSFTVAVECLKQPSRSDAYGHRLAVGIDTTDGKKGVTLPEGNLP